jgi:hypothetical protein
MQSMYAMCPFHPCILTNASDRRHEAATALISLSNGFGLYTDNSRNSINDKDDNLDGVVSETNGEPHVKYVCDVFLPNPMY